MVVGVAGSIGIVGGSSFLGVEEESVWRYCE